MKSTKFAFFLNKFFTVCLPNTRGCTPATIDSYRYAFIMFLNFMEDKGIPADEIEIIHLTYAMVLEFLTWLQEKRGNSISTRNQRQAAINSFIRYLMYEFPDYLAEFQMILKIPVKKAPQKEISYMKTDGVKLFFEQVDTLTPIGLRNHAMLTLLYTTAIRVSELINIRVKDVSLDAPPTLLAHGKGQKSRYVPLIKEAVAILQNYIEHAGLDNDKSLNEWLFKSHLKEKLTRQGVNYIVKKYVLKARAIDAVLVPNDFSPHKMRHSSAMGLVDSGVDLIYIRDLLGHVSVKTTEVYAKADAARKREAIEAASKEIVPIETPEWEKNARLKDWLKKFNRP
jgi:site-specific recombinase XerD